MHIHCFPAPAVTQVGIMPVRDSQGRFCGTLHRKEVDGQWDRYYFVLDEDKCLLRYFSLLDAKVSQDSALICLSLLCKIKPNSGNLT